MALPQSVTDALAKLDVDYGVYQADIAIDAANASALADAQHAKDTSANTVAGDAAGIKSDTDSLVTLIEASYPVPPTATV